MMQAETGFDADCQWQIKTLTIYGGCPSGIMSSGDARR